MSVLSQPQMLARLAPGMREYLRECMQYYPADAVEQDVAAQRRFYSAMCEGLASPLPESVQWRDEHIAGVAVRRYTPPEVSHTVLYFHGGGFVVGDLESHHDICAELCLLAGVELISVDYALSPERPFPEDYNDVLKVFDALEAQSVVLAGDSAGATLAASLALHRRVQGLVLAYPALGGQLLGLDSYTRYASAPALTLADVETYAQLRIGAAEISEREKDPRVNPLAATDYSLLPPCHVFVAQYDPLSDDGAEWARRLDAAGVPVNNTVEQGMVHGYLRARRFGDAAQQAFERVAAALRLPSSS